jgi:hexosaminidase
VRTFLVAGLLLASASAVSASPALVPAPAELKHTACRGAVNLSRPLRFPYGIDAGGFQLLRERWTALGIRAPVVAGPRSATDRSLIDVVAQQYTDLDHPHPTTDAYSLQTNSGKITLAAQEQGHTGEAEFDALMTLAQLPERRGSHWVLPCVAIKDAPAMRWRILSDDVSRGPFPTMDYAKERIRTLASLKLNGWSPYMEQVFEDPQHPFVAFPNVWSPAQLHELAVYARRYHVTLIPEQQTFAHMHESLKWEQLAPLAELPHGYLLAESDPATYAYLEPLVKGVVAATKPVPFVHIGSDEPIDLGRGRTPRTPQVFADHVKRVAAFMAGSGARPMIWDDAIQQDHAILALLPKNVVVVSFHYGIEKTYKPYIDTIANAGFDQMIAPGAANWNEIYPDLTTAYTNVARFGAEAKGASGMLGMFMTVWHDDGETLFEATWPAVAYAAATAWQSKPVDDATWHPTFARAFFGTDDPRFAADLDALQAIRPLLHTTPSDQPDYLFWRDPFDPRIQARARTMDLAGVRNRAESVITHLWPDDAEPPLHGKAAATMMLGALRYDQLARRLQIGKEARDYYEDARAHAVKPNVSQVYRSLGIAKYLCWEMRNALADIEHVYVAAWRRESTLGGLDHMSAHYRVAEDDAQRCADRIDGVMREDYLRHDTVPPWDDVISSAQPQVTPSAR